MPTPGQEDGPGLTSVRLPLVDPSHYTVSGELARGGIGRVLLARDVRLMRTVALKQMLRSSRRAESRFVAEALITARLQHPSIIPVYEAGRWPDGEPFYAMKLVSGRPLSDLIPERARLEDRLALLPHVLAVTEAIAYAHSERILHRDLKPSNVLVGDFGETIVIDWGLAKELSPSAPLAPLEPPAGLTPSDASTLHGGLTQVGTVLGTPAYMPPEQAMGQQVDERADIYALGAILYHLLAGTQPYMGPDHEHVLRQVLEGPPPPLSQSQEDIPGDLLAIVAKAMARAPTERYATARALAEDLRRFQTGQIVGAYRYSRTELLHRFLRRYQTVARVAVGALLLLFALGGVSLHRIRQERDTAREAEARALDQSDQLLLAQARATAAQAPNEALLALQKVSARFHDTRVLRTIASDARAQGFDTVLTGHQEHINDAFFSDDARYIVSTGDDHTVRVWDLRQGNHKVFTGHTDEVWRVRWLPGGHDFITSSKDGTLRQWNLDSGEGRVFATLRGPVSAMGLGCQGQCLLAMGQRDEELHLWNLLTHEERTFHTGMEGALWLVTSPDGSQVFLQGILAAPSVRGDLERGSFERLTPLSQEISAVFAPDGRLFTADVEGRLFVWRPGESKGQLLVQGLGTVSAILFIPRTSQVALGTVEGPIHLYDLLTGRIQDLPEGHAEPVYGMDLTVDGQYLVSGSADRTERIWNLLTRAPPRVLRGARQRADIIRLSQDGRWLLTSNQDGRIHVFPIEAERRGLLSEGPPQASLVLSPDGRRLACLSTQGTLRLLESDSGGLLLEEPGYAPGTLAFSPRGAWLAAGGLDGRIHLKEGDTGRSVRVFQGQARAVVTLAFSARGEGLASVDEAGEVWLWNPNESEGRLLGHHLGGVQQVAFSPEGPWLATAGKDGTVRLWDVRSGVFRTLRGHGDAVTSLAFSAEGKRMVSGSMDHTVRYWDLETGLSTRVEVSGGGVLGLRYVPGSERLVVRSQWDGRLTLLEGPHGEVRRTIESHDGYIQDMALSPDGTRSATAGLDRTLRLCELASGECRTLRGHTGGVTAVMFFPDGRSLVSTGQDGSIRVWPDDLPDDLGSLRQWMSEVTRRTLQSSDSTRCASCPASGIKAGRSVRHPSGTPR